MSEDIEPTPPEPDPEEQASLSRQLVEAGAELAGNMATAALALLGSPEAAFGGAATGVFASGASKREIR